MKKIRSNRIPKKLDRLFMKGWQAVFPFGQGRHPGSGPPRRVLVTKTCCMGDGILSLYALREWKLKYPEIKIDVLTSARIRDIYAELKEIDEIFSFPLSGRNLWLEIINPFFWLSFFRLVLALRKNRYDLLLDMELYYGYPLVLKSLLGIPQSRGFRVEGAYTKLHDRLVARGKDTPEWVCFFQLLGVEVPYDRPLTPIYPRLKPAAAGPVTVGVVPGASFNWPQKQWSWEHFAEVMKGLSEYGCRFVIFGSAHEAANARHIENSVLADVENTAGRLSFSELRKKVAECAFVVGNDTGTMHLASALGIPCVTVFGPTNHHKWNALTSTPVFAEIPCRPCYYLSTMPACTHVNCLKQLSPRRVLDACIEKMGQAGII